MVVDVRSAALALSLVALLVPVTGAQFEPQPMIVGGSTASPEDWMFTVALLDASVRSNALATFCGGSLVAAQWVLTAAHCVTGLAPSAVNVLAGTATLNRGGTRLKVQSIFVHPSYDATTQDYDVALLLLQRAPRTPVTVPITTDAALAEPGDLAKVAGWGDRGDGGDGDFLGSLALMEVTVPFVDVEDCNAPESYNGAITERMLCAGDYAAGGIDSCQGDSGGPLVVQDSGHAALVGVVSWGTGCAIAGFPGVYTSLLDVGPWVQAVLATPLRYVSIGVTSPWVLAFHLEVTDAGFNTIGTCEGLTAIVASVVCDFADGVGDDDPSDLAVLLKEQRMPVVGLPGNATNLTFTPVAIGRSLSAANGADADVAFAGDTALALPLKATPAFKGLAPTKVTFAPKPIDGLLKVNLPKELPKAVVAPTVTTAGAATGWASQAAATAMASASGVTFRDLPDDPSDLAALASSDDLQAATRQLLADTDSPVARALAVPNDPATPALFEASLPDGCELRPSAGFSFCSAGDTVTQVLRGNHAILPAGTYSLAGQGQDLDGNAVTAVGQFAPMLTAGRLTTGTPKVPLDAGLAGLKIVPAGVRGFAQSCTVLYAFLGSACFAIYDTDLETVLAECTFIDLAYLEVGTGILPLCDGPVSLLTPPFVAIAAPGAPIAVEAIAVNLDDFTFYGGYKVFTPAAGKYTVVAPRLVPFVDDEV